MLLTIAPKRIHTSKHTEKIPGNMHNMKGVSSEN
jgi:hypothetical protein